MDIILQTLSLDQERTLLPLRLLQVHPLCFLMFPLPPVPRLDSILPSPHLELLQLTGTQTFLLPISPCPHLIFPSLRPTFHDHHLLFLHLVCHTSELRLKCNGVFLRHVFRASSRFSWWDFGSINSSEISCKCYMYFYIMEAVIRSGKRNL